MASFLFPVLTLSHRILDWLSVARIVPNETHLTVIATSGNFCLPVDPADTGYESLWRRSYAAVTGAGSLQY